MIEKFEELIKKSIESLNDENKRLSVNSVFVKAKEISKEDQTFNDVKISKDEIKKVASKFGITIKQDKNEDLDNERNSILESAERFYQKEIRNGTDVQTRKFIESFHIQFFDVENKKLNQTLNVNLHELYYGFLEKYFEVESIKKSAFLRYIFYTNGAIPREVMKFVTIFNVGRDKSYRKLKNIDELGLKWKDFSEDEYFYFIHPYINQKSKRFYVQTNFLLVEYFFIKKYIEKKQKQNKDIKGYGLKEIVEEEVIKLGIVPTKFAEVYNQTIRK